MSTRLTEEERKHLDHALYSFSKWLEIREQNGIKPPSSHQQFICDASHSSLLARLFKRIEPLPQPPPKAFSYPWYSLIEKGEGESFDVHLVPSMGPDVISISQSPTWKIRQKISDKHYVVSHKDSDVLWDLTEVMTKPIASIKGYDREFPIWKLKRLSDQTPSH